MTTPALTEQLPPRSVFIIKSIIESISDASLRATVANLFTKVMPTAHPAIITPVVKPTTAPVVTHPAPVTHTGVPRVSLTADELKQLKALVVSSGMMNESTASQKFGV